MKIKKIEQGKKIESTESKTAASQESSGLKVRTDIKAGPVDIAVCG